MKKLISLCQFAFVPPRQMIDGVLFNNELVDFTKTKRKEYMMIKIDFEKNICLRMLGLPQIHYGKNEI